MMPEIPEQQQVPLFRAYLLGCFRLQRRTTPQGAAAVYAEVSPAQWGKRRQAMRLLMVLLARPGRRADKDLLLELFWPDTEPEVAAVYLTQTVAKLRKVLRLVEGGESLLIGEYAGYRMAGQKQLWMDADAAEALLNQVSRQGADGLPLVQEAVTLLQQGPFLQEAEGTWVLGRRGRLADLRKTSQIRLAQMLVQQDRLHEAETQLFMLLEEDPTDEDVLSALMWLLHRQDKTHQALRVYERSCEVFGGEGLEPTEEVKLLAERLRSEKQRSVSHPKHRSLDWEDSIEHPSSTLSKQSNILSTLTPQGIAFAHEIGEVKQKSMWSELILPATRMQTEKLEEVAHLDDATFFGLQLAQAVTLIHQWFGMASFCHELQNRLDQEIKKLDRLKTQNSFEAFTLSRRSFLTALATLPIALLTSTQQKHKFVLMLEEVLPTCAASITACWV